MSARKMMILGSLVLAGLTVGMTAKPAMAWTYGYGYTYVTPAPVYCPPPVYVAPAPVYCPPPVYVAPRPYYPVYRSYGYYPAYPRRSVSFGFGYRRW